jgi:large subunit ribosomal protein L4
MKLTVASTVGQNSTLTVNDQVFAAFVSQPLIAQAVRVYLSNQRQGTAKTKTRSEINRTKKKWFKQKGTGNARHGARTPSLFVGGGVAHGPTGMQNWNLKMSATMKKRALTSVLTAQVKNIIVCDDLEQLDGKTVSADKLFNKMLPDAKHILVVLPKASNLVMRSLRNLDAVYVTTADLLTTYEVAYADAIVMTKESVKMLEDRLVKVEGAPKAPKAEKPAEVVKKAAPAKKVAKPAAKAVKAKAAPKKKVAAKK